MCARRARLPVLRGLRLAFLDVRRRCIRRRPQLEAYALRQSSTGRSACHASRLCSPGGAAAASPEPHAAVVKGIADVLVRLLSPTRAHAWVGRDVAA